MSQNPDLLYGDVREPGKNGPPDPLTSEYPALRTPRMCGGAVNRQPGYRARNLQRWTQKTEMEKTLNQHNQGTTQHFKQILKYKLTHIKLEKQVNPRQTNHRRTKERKNKKGSNKESTKEEKKQRKKEE